MNGSQAGEGREIDMDAHQQKLDEIKKAS